MAGMEGMEGPKGTEGTEGLNGKGIPDPEQPAGPRDLRELEAWLRLAADSALTLLRLGRAELALTLSELPRMLLLGLVLLPFALLAWVGLSVFIAWIAYALSDEMGLAIFTFFLLQAVPSALLVLKILRIQRVLFFPRTRRQLARLQAFLKDEQVPEVAGVSGVSGVSEADRRRGGLNER